MKEKARVVFILGSGHCGSTLLDLMLDSHPLCFGLGEVHGISEHSQCTCGETARACPFWSSLAFGFINLDQKIYRSKIDFFRGAQTFRSVSTRARIDSDVLGRRIADAYRAMDAAVLVDSSKSVDRVELLTRTGTIDPIIIHLVRDGRAVTWSYLRKYRRLWPFMFKWAAENAKIELFKRRYTGTIISMRYENLVRTPEVELRRICDALSIPFSAEMCAFTSGVHHQIGGNRMRFEKNATLRLDTAWENAMPFSYRALWAVLFGWLNTKYGYSRYL